MNLPLNISNECGFLDGPFAIVVTEQVASDKLYPLVVCPDGGYKTREEALLYIEKHYANRKTPYLGLNFCITSIRSENEFGRFCSWED